MSISDVYLWCVCQCVCVCEVWSYGKAGVVSPIVFNAVERELPSKLPLFNDLAMANTGESRDEEI